MGDRFHRCTTNSQANTSVGTTIKNVESFFFIIEFVHVGADEETKNGIVHLFLETNAGDLPSGSWVFVCFVKIVRGVFRHV
jgi:hypothetical protein